MYPNAWMNESSDRSVNLQIADPIAQIITTLAKRYAMIVRNDLMIFIIL
jgi:hypothetical protein